jgi:hypothetical protein
MRIIKSYYANFPKRCLSVSRLFLGLINKPSKKPEWRTRWHVHPKRWLNFNGLNGIIYQTTELYITTSVTTSNPTNIYPVLRPKRSCCMKPYILAVLNTLGNGLLRSVCSYGHNLNPLCVRGQVSHPWKNKCNHNFPISIFKFRDKNMRKQKFLTKYL